MIIYPNFSLESPAQIGGYTQAPIEGVSMFYSFNNSNAPTTKQIQYFEMLGNRGIWYKGWRAVTFHGRLPWESQGKWSFDQDKWELYDVEKDFSECHDLADRHPDKLKELVEMWWAEAGRYNVLPLDDRTHARLLARETSEKTSYTFYPGTVRIPQGSGPHTKNRSFNILADVEIPASGAEGPICAVGGIGSGWSMYIKDQKLIFCYNNNGERYYVRSQETLPTGMKLNLRFEFEKTGQEKFGAGGIGRLYINDKKVGETKFPRTVRYIYSLDETFDIGIDTGTAVTDEYKANTKFTGIIEKVVVDLSGERHIDAETETKMIMKRQ